jgi:hypothetical protein
LIFFLLEAEHSNSVPVHKPFSLSYTYAQTGYDSEETPEQRSARMGEVYNKGVASAETAEHSHKIPVHKKSTLAYTYDHTNVQLPPWIEAGSMTPE